MHKIIEKTYELIDTLDESNLMKELTKYKSKVLSNQFLLKEINKAKNSNDEYEIRLIRQNLLKNRNYNKYIKNLNELNFLILKINNKFNSYFSNRRC